MAFVIAIPLLLIADEELPMPELIADEELPMPELIADEEPPMLALDAAAFSSATFVDGTQGPSILIFGAVAGRLLQSAASDATVGAGIGVGVAVAQADNRTIAIIR